MREYTASQVQPVYQRLRAWRAGQLLLDTRGAHLYFPDDRHPRYQPATCCCRHPARSPMTGSWCCLPRTPIPGSKKTGRPTASRATPITALTPSRHVQILAGQTVVAETGRPVLLIETGVAPRWYIPLGDVAWARLEPVPARTTCQYKGEASYFRMRGSDAELWTYRHPDPEAAAIAGHVAAAGQPGVQVIVDGTPERQP
jgi:uncharacterized protein (DUF427 family)